MIQQCCSKINKKIDHTRCIALWVVIIAFTLYVLWKSRAKSHAGDTSVRTVNSVLSGCVASSTPDHSTFFRLSLFSESLSERKKEGDVSLFVSGEVQSFLGTKICSGSVVLNGSWYSRSFVPSSPVQKVWLRNLRTTKWRTRFRL